MGEASLRSYNRDSYKTGFTLVLMFVILAFANLALSVANLAFVLDTNRFWRHTLSRSPGKIDSDKLSSRTPLHVLLLGTLHAPAKLQAGHSGAVSGAATFHVGRGHQGKRGASRATGARRWHVHVSCTPITEAVEELVPSWSPLKGVFARNPEFEGPAGAR